MPKKRPENWFPSFVTENYCSKDLKGGVMNRENATGIWVFAETRDDKLESTVPELLAVSHDLSKVTGEKVTAVLLERQDLDLAPALIEYGADVVLEVRSDILGDFDPVLYKDALAQLVEKYNPNIFLFGATHKGRALAPRLQARLQTGLTADCLELVIDDTGLLVQTKPSYGDNLMCTITCPEARPQMATVRPNVFHPLPRNPENAGTVVSEELSLEPNENYRVVKKTRVPAQVSSIGNADKIVSIGRGIGARTNLTQVQLLAERLHAGIGVTRPLADNGWFSHDEQIGQSGITVQPRLLLNLGISGAVQYKAGMKNSGVVVSVNRDIDAPIFSVSNYGYVGDVNEFVQALLAECSNLE
jgi:electron transfer flavoprotein alpha subunit